MNPLGGLLRAVSGLRAAIVKAATPRVPEEAPASIPVGGFNSGYWHGLCGSAVDQVKQSEDFMRGYNDAVKAKADFAKLRGHDVK